MGPSTVRNPGAKSIVASMTRAMMLPENITVPVATACKARREFWWRVDDAPPWGRPHDQQVQAGWPTIMRLGQDAFKGVGT